MGKRFPPAAKAFLRVFMVSALVIAGSISISPKSQIISWLNGPSVASADTPSTLGYEFSFIVPPNLDTATVYVYVSSAESGSGTWQIGSGSVTSFNLTANQATSLTIGASSTANLASANTSGDTTISGKMIRITTSVPASVYADNNSQYTSDATVIIPNAYLGTEYRALSMKNEFAHSRVSIVAIENSTTISVTPKTVLGSRAAGTTFTISLDAGQTYSLSGTSAGQDVSGTKISSSKPVAVFSSVDCFNGSTYFPRVSRNQSGACDVLFEQVPPIDAWGKNFITNGFADKNNGGMPVKILAKEANTQVSVNGTVVATLGDGEYYEYNYFESASATGTATNSGLYISATKSVLVGVFMRGGSSYGSSNQTGDPAMAYLAPFEQNLNEYTVVSATGNTAQLLNIAIPKSALSSLRIDGVAPSQSSPNSFVDFTVNGTVWSLGQIITTTGSHNLRADQAFSVMVYGANSANSYAYTGGQSLAPIALVDSITLQTNGNYEGDVGQEVCIQVNVLDANGAALPGVRVDGSISGVNSSTALVATSNNQGVASLCYDSASAGNDTVTLTSNGRSATTQVAWTVVEPGILYDPNSLSVVSGSAMPSISPTNSGSPVTSWSISPSLPGGLSLNATTGVISGTPTATISQTNFTITATNAAGTDTAVVALEVTAAAVLPTINYATGFSLTLDQAISAIQPTTTGTYPTWSLTGTLPVGLTFNSQNGQITGTPTRLKASATYTVTATNAQGSTSDSFSIEVVASVPDISYTPSSANFVSGTAISPMLPSNAGSPATSWSISPSLPAGLSFNSSTGQISGTPSTTSSQTTYTVTANNSAGSDTTTVSLSVVASLAPPDILYTSSTLSLTENSAMVAVLPSNAGGAATSWSVTPSLPTGLSFNSSSGRISGTPTVSQSSSNYTVTATNSAGSDTFVVSISVTGVLAAPSITFATATLNLTVNSAMSALTPTNTGGAASSWSVAPSLPAGLTIDASTGVISGTPTSTLATSNFVVTATNASGNGTFTISITVVSVSSTSSSSTTVVASPSAPSTATTSTTSTTVVRTITVTTTTVPSTSTTVRPRRRPTPTTIQSTTTSIPATNRVTTTTAPKRPVAPTSTVVRPVSTIAPIVVPSTTAAKPIPSSTTTVKQQVSTTLALEDIQNRINSAAANVYDLSIPVYVNGALPNPRAGQPIAIQTGSADPVNVLVINEQVLQLETTGTSLRVNVLDEEGQLVPVSVTGAIVISKNNTFVVSGSGWQPGTEMVAWMFSSPQKLGVIQVPEDGQYTAELSVPDNIDIGEHTVQVNGLTPNGSLRSMSMEVLYLGDTAISPNLASENLNQFNFKLWILGLCVLVIILSSYWLFFASRKRRRQET